FSNWFGKRCREAGPIGTAHGLRKTAATRLANAGCSTDQIKAITGHQTTKEVERYTRAADQQRLAQAALELQLRAEREQSFVQPNPGGEKRAKKPIKSGAIVTEKPRQGFPPAGPDRSRPRSRRYIRGRKLGRERDSI